MITVSSSGSFKKTEDFFGKMKSGEIFNSLERYAQQGTDALALATPKDSGLAASSWEHKVIRNRRLNRYTIVWSNTNIESGVPVVIMLQYGHATRNGGWIEGRDFINPVIRPLFDKIASEIWEEVKRG